MPHPLVVALKFRRVTSRRRLVASTVLAAAALLFAGASAEAATPVLTEGFESGAPGWTATGLWHVQADPESVAISPAINPPLVTLPDAGTLPGAASGTHAAWFGEASTGTFCGSDFASITQDPKGGCTSTAPFEGTLESPTFDLTGAASAQMTFSAWYEIESVNADAFDVMGVDYTTDDGATWTRAGTLNPIDNPAGAHDQPYSNNGLGALASWHDYAVDLSGAAGQPAVRVRLEFDTVDSLYQGFRGLLVDDVAISTPYAVGAPVIASAAPTCASADGTPLALSGEHFVTGSKLLVDGADTAASVLSTQRIEFLAPAGQHDVQVQAPGGALSNVLRLCAPVPTPTPTPPPDQRANLVVSLDDSRATVHPGQEFNYIVNVHNKGPGAASNVKLEQAFTKREVFVSSKPAQGSCSGVDTLHCSLGSLAAGASTSVRVRVIPQYPDLALLAPKASASAAARAAGAIASSKVTSAVTVSSDTVDADPSDNADREKTTVKLPRSARLRPPAGRVRRAKHTRVTGRHAGPARAGAHASFFHTGSVPWSADSANYWYAANFNCQSGPNGFVNVRGLSWWHNAPGTVYLAWKYKLEYRIPFGTGYRWSTSPTIYHPFTELATLTSRTGFVASNGGLNVTGTDGNRHFTAAAGNVYRIQVQWKWWRHYSNIPDVPYHQYGYTPVVWCNSGS